MRRKRHSSRRKHPRCQRRRCRDALPKWASSSSKPHRTISRRSRSSWAASHPTSYSTTRISTSPFPAPRRFGLLRAADRARRHAREHARVPGGDLRTRGHRHTVQGRGHGPHPAGQRYGVRTRRRHLDQRHEAGTSYRQQAARRSSRHRSGRMRFSCSMAGTCPPRITAGPSHYFAWITPFLSMSKST